MAGATRKTNPVLVILSAPSGAGKTTLCQMLLKDFPGLTLSISTTTRAPRPKGGQLEKNGVDYYFVSKDEFEKKIRENRFAEWAMVHGNYYGTSKDTIETAFKSGKAVLLDIDVQGAKSLGIAYPKQCLTIFVFPPCLQELEKRLRTRASETETSILERLRNAQAEMSQSHLFDHVVINHELDAAYREIQALVETRLYG